ncbi:MAG: PorP/SprF family type IX secretion system membrane protein [Saprospiraceae bacterium]
MRTLTTQVLLICFTLMSFSLLGQDLHYSQRFASPLNLSPALAGLYGGEHRFVGNARNQWNNVPVDYLSFSGSYDTKIKYEPGKTGFWGVGAQINQDIAGDSRLELTQLGLNVSYTKRLAERHLITLGGQLGGSSRRFDQSDLLFPDQSNPGKPNNATAQTFDNSSILYATVGAGANWRYQVRDSRTFVNVGGGLYNLNTPVVSFNGNDEFKLHERASAFVLGTYQLTERVDLIANYTQQWQGPHRESLAGIRGKFYIVNPLVRTLAIQLGAHYRFDDAIIPVIKANVNNWEVGFSYDMNTSAFDTATDANGGPELAVIYTIQKIRPEICLLCPEYL